MFTGQRLDELCFGWEPSADEVFAACEDVTQHNCTSLGLKKAFSDDILANNDQCTSFYGRKLHRVDR
jgi:hypothetical protein